MHGFRSLSHWRQVSCVVTQSVTRIQSRAFGRSGMGITFLLVAWKIAWKVCRNFSSQIIK